MLFLLVLVPLALTSASNQPIPFKCSTLCDDKSYGGEVTEFMKHLCQCLTEKHPNPSLSVVERDSDLCEYLCSIQQGGDACRCRNASLPGKRQLRRVQSTRDLSQGLRQETIDKDSFTKRKHFRPVMSVFQQNDPLCDYLCSIQMGGDACRCRNPSLPGKRQLQLAQPTLQLSQVLRLDTFVNDSLTKRKPSSPDLSVYKRDESLCEYLCSIQMGGDACRCRNPSLPGKRDLSYI